MLVSESDFFVLDIILSFKDSGWLSSNGGFVISFYFSNLADNNAHAEFGSRVVFSAL